MAYSTTIPPRLLVPRIGGGTALWAYASVDLHTDVDAADYFSNGDALGMKVNDVVFHKDSTTDATAMTMHKVVTVSSTYPGAVDLSDGTVVGSATNTD